MEGGPNKTKQTLYEIGHHTSVCGCALRKVVCLLYTHADLEKKRVGRMREGGGKEGREREKSI